MWCMCALCTCGVCIFVCDVYIVCLVWGCLFGMVYVSQRHMMYFGHHRYIWELHNMSPLCYEKCSLNYSYHKD